MPTFLKRFCQNIMQGNKNYYYQHMGTYIVVLVAETEFGCKDTAIDTIKVASIFTFYAPNAFTPNHDLINKEFKPIGAGWSNSNYEFRVFDRWGNVIFETNDINETWNGKIGGNSSLVPLDVYIWKVTVYDRDGNKHKFVGDVTILK